MRFVYDVKKKNEIMVREGKWKVKRGRSGEGYSISVRNVSFLIFFSYNFFM